MSHSLSPITPHPSSFQGRAKNVLRSDAQGGNPQVLPFLALSCSGSLSRTEVRPALVELAGNSKSMNDIQQTLGPHMVQILREKTDLYGERDESLCFTERGFLVTG